MGKICFPASSMLSHASCACSGRKSKRCRRVSCLFSGPFRHGRWVSQHDSFSVDRQTLAEPVESEVHLAHALVRYLGVNGPEALAKYAIKGVGELVDFISRVRQGFPIINWLH